MPDTKQENIMLPQEVERNAAKDLAIATKLSLAAIALVAAAWPLAIAFDGCERYLGASEMNFFQKFLPASFIAFGTAGTLLGVVFAIADFREAPISLPATRRICHAIAIFAFNPVATIAMFVAAVSFLETLHLALRAACLAIAWIWPSIVSAVLIVRADVIWSWLTHLVAFLFATPLRATVAFTVVGAASVIASRPCIRAFVTEEAVIRHERQLLEEEEQAQQRKKAEAAANDGAIPGTA